MADMKKHKLGWIGIGRMGYAMAERLAKAGCDITVWNRTKSKAEPLAKSGAKVADNLTELADCDIVFTMVSTGKDVKEVLFGPNGVMSAGGKPKIIVDSTSISLEESAEIRAKLAEKGIKLLAAPVSGNAKVIKVGKLTVVASGPQDAFDTVTPYLEAIGRGVSYVGDGELSRIAKICHNVMLGVVIQNLCEITVLAEKAGMQRHAFLDFLNKSVMGSMFTTYKTPALSNLDFHVTFTPELLRKDIDLGLAAGRAHGVPMPTTAITRDLVQTLIGHGYDQDFSQLLLLQAKASGIELKPENVNIGDGL
ncbi:MAG: NAD(P)-dependent oxidoreductase [Burkholderiales bacterium]|nr:NAD(P)-dependent oxidoreductase [Burkholderiales bacterium]MDP2400281.1 NAD(P)-dependent oxidoreductase [Burkholderiales bacterium]